MPSPTSDSYVVASGVPVYAGRYAAGRLAGGVLLDDSIPSGTLGVNVSQLTGSITWNDSIPAGTLTAPVPIPSGTVSSINVNTRSAIDPRYDSNQNAAYPAIPIWDVTNGTQWAHVTDYCGSVFATGLGSNGSLLQYAAAGHSAGGPCIWLRFDVASGLWSLIGKALQTDSLKDYFNPPVQDAQGNYLFSNNPPATRFDNTWGDYIGASSDWQTDWAQPGFNPPEGSHTRGSFAYRPPNKAGNIAGQVLHSWQPTGKQGGTPSSQQPQGIRGSHYFDLDTGQWYRTANLRPSSSSLELNYYEPLDVAMGVVQEFSHYANFVDLLDCQTMTWRRVTVSDPSAPYVLYDSTQFICGGLFVVASHTQANNPVLPTQFWALKISDIVAGNTLTWTQLIVTATSWPVALVPNTAGNVNGQQIRWVQNPLDENFYATNKGSSGQVLWKMTPPVGTDAAKLSGTWSITTQTLTGQSIGLSGFDYSRLQFVPAISAFVWTTDAVACPVQAIRPVGV